MKKKKKGETHFFSTLLLIPLSSVRTELDGGQDPALAALAVCCPLLALPQPQDIVLMRKRVEERDGYTRHWLTETQAALLSWYFGM